MHATPTNIWKVPAYLPQWVWLSPNLVPRGFVRDTDPRFGEVKDWTPGCAVRFPGLPGGAWQMSASDSIIAEVLSVLREAGIPFQPLEPHHAFFGGIWPVGM